MPGTFTNLRYHIVFSTKHRQPLITSTLQEELYKYMEGIIRGEGGVLLEIGLWIYFRFQIYRRPIDERGRFGFCRIAFVEPIPSQEADGGSCVGRRHTKIAPLHSEYE